MKRTESDAKKSSSKGRSRAKSRAKRFAVCVKNDGYAGSLDLGKLYETMEDPFGEEHGLIRVVDESGEDYLYSAKWFVAIEVPKQLETVLRRIGRKRSAA